MLDAKSAFDVVVHKKCYESYITSELMIIIGQLSIACTHAKTSIKWKEYISESFNIEQGVRQGPYL